MPGMPDNVILINPAAGNDLQLTMDELQGLFARIRNNALNEVLSKVTDKLDPSGKFDREMALIEVLKAVNDMRTDERQPNEKA